MTTLQSGQGRAFRDGIFSTAAPVPQAGDINQRAFADGVLGALGATMASGPGRAFSDGVFSQGVPSHGYPGPNMRAYADGVLGMSGLGALGAILPGSPEAAMAAWERCFARFPPAADYATTLQHAESYVGCLRSSSPYRTPSPVFRRGSLRLPGMRGLGAVMASGAGHAFRGGLFSTPYNQHAAGDGILGQFTFYEKASPTTIAVGVAAVVGVGALGWWALSRRKR